MNNVIYIGASGFIGTRLINITKEKINISNLDKQQSPFFPEITTLGDVRNRKDLETALKKQEIVVLLAAEHKDNISPSALYYEVNVQGTKNVLEAMEKNGVNNIIFTSSVAVYGLNKHAPDEHSPADPFNHYGKSKWQAEELLRNWYSEDPENRSLTIIRPTVVFGERNRGNVFYLLNQIAKGKFLMVGKGTNYKSMAYVENVAEFIKYHMQNNKPGYQLFNYVDKPDVNMRELVSLVEKSLNRKIPSISIPYWMGMLVGFVFDNLHKLSGREFHLSSIRIKKFCATTQYDATSAHTCGFKAPCKLIEGLQKTLDYEFISEKPDIITFDSE